MKRRVSLPAFGRAAADVSPEAALQVAKRRIAAAASTDKCRTCGCLHEAVRDLASSGWAEPLRPVLDHARQAFGPQAYDCLGCAECHPAIAMNALADALPEHAGAMRSCPTEPVRARPGWPPLPGDYEVLRYDAPVAVCTLNSTELMDRLACAGAPGLGIVGTLSTENLGIDRLVQNVSANPHLRFIVVCGADTEGAIGHLPGRSLLALATAGLDDRGRIVGAPGRRPVLKNTPVAVVEHFRAQVEVVDMIGEQDPARVLEVIATCAARHPGPPPGEVGANTDAAIIPAGEPARLVLDPAGYVVIYTDRPRALLVAEHYGNDGVLDAVISGVSPAAILAALVERGLVSRLEHAGYIGQELARAERALADGSRYVQDRAAGETTRPGAERRR